MSKIKYFFVRTYIYMLSLLFFISGGLSLLVLMPAYKQAFAPHTRYADIKILALWAYGYKIIWRSLSDKNYRAMFTVNITGEPRIHTDTRSVRVKQNWPGGPEDCEQCEASCCLALKCPLLAEDKRCQSYGSLFFAYFHCGRYPENQQQIAYYQCPKWEVAPSHNHIMSGS